MKRYCCVLVTYNRLELLKECIAAIKKQSIPFSKVFIINNNSTDGTKEFLQGFNDDLFAIFHMDKNIGGAGGFCEGLRHFTPDYDWCLLIDDDAILNNNYLKEINQFIEDERFNTIEAFSGTVKVKDNIDITHRRRMTNRITLKAVPVEKKEYSKDYFEYDLSSFCGLIIKQSLKEKIGLPEKDFFIWYDDTEYSLRIIKYSKIINVNSAILNHKTDLVHDTDFSWKIYYGYRNSLVTGLKHSSNKRIYILFSCVRLICIMIYYLLGIIFSKKRKNCVLKLKAHRCAFFDGINLRLGVSDFYFPGMKYD